MCDAKTTHGESCGSSLLPIAGIWLRVPSHELPTTAFQAGACCDRFRYRFPKDGHTFVGTPANCTCPDNTASARHRGITGLRRLAQRLCEDDYSVNFLLWHDSVLSITGSTDKGYNISYPALSVTGTLPLGGLLYPWYDNT